jgi:hypothetical protein
MPQQQAQPNGPSVEEVAAQKETQQSQDDEDDEATTTELEDRVPEATMTTITSGIEARNARFVDLGVDEVVALPSGVKAGVAVAAGTITHALVMDEYKGNPIDFIRVWVSTPATTFSVIAQNNDEVAVLKELISEDLSPEQDRIPVDPVNIKVKGALKPQYDNGTHRGALLAADHVTPINDNELARHSLQAAKSFLDRVETVGDEAIMADSVEEYAGQVAGSLSEITPLAE